MGEKLKVIIYQNLYRSNFLLNKQSPDFLRLKGFADIKANLIQMIEFLFKSIENIVGKGENAGNQYFLLFPTMFSKGFFPRVIKSWDCVVKLRLLRTFGLIFDHKLWRNIQKRTALKWQYF